MLEKAFRFPAGGRRRLECLKGACSPIDASRSPPAQIVGGSTQARGGDADVNK